MRFDPYSLELPTFGWGEMTEFAECAIEICERAGISVPSNSRIRRYVKTLREFDHGGFSSTTSSLQDALLIAHAARESPELYCILSGLSTTLNAPILRQRIESLLDDAAIPAGEAPNSPGRDSQFELYVGAVCRAAGARVEFDEPDVLLDFKGFRLAAAAKRVKSPQKVGRRLKEACKQIAKCKRPGIVFLDLSAVVAPSGILRADSTDGIRAWGDEAYQRVFDEHRDEFAYWRGVRRLYKEGITALWKREFNLADYRQFINTGPKRNAGDPGLAED